MLAGSSASRGSKTGCPYHASGTGCWNGGWRSSRTPCARLPGPSECPCAVLSYPRGGGRSQCTGSDARYALSIPRKHMKTSENCRPRRGEDSPGEDSGGKSWSESSPNYFRAAAGLELDERSSSRSQARRGSPMPMRCQELTALCGLAALEADAGRLQRARSVWARRAFFL